MVDHPKIVKLLKCFESNDFKYIIFEFCPLGTVKEHITQSAGYRPREIAYIVKQVLLALAAMHG